MLVNPLPAGAAEVAEAVQLTAEVRPLLNTAHRAQGIFQVRIDLHLKTFIIFGDNPKDVPPTAITPSTAGGDQ